MTHKESLAQLNSQLCSFTLPELKALKAEAQHMLNIDPESWVDAGDL